MPCHALQADMMLQVWRGATHGMTAHSQAAMWALTQRLLHPLLSLQHVYRKQPRATVLLLKLAAGLVEAHVSYLGVRLCPSSQSKADSAAAVAICSGPSMQWDLEIGHQGPFAPA